jgi:D-lyxose ketol-isomerase
MKRSEVNSIIREARDFFDERKFILPVWALWSPEDWKGMYDSCSEIIDDKLGWDITDFGSGDFENTGLTLFTNRNGNREKKGKMFCETIMIAGEKQATPLHLLVSDYERYIYPPILTASRQKITCTGEM